MARISVAKGTERRLIAAIALVLFACGKTPTEKLFGNVDAASSWIATLQFASESWLGNRVPTSFVRESVKSARKTLAKTLKAVAASEAPQTLRENVRKQLQAADATAIELTSAVDRGDRAGATRAARRFADAHRALDQLRQQNSP